MESNDSKTGSLENLIFYQLITKVAHELMNTPGPIFRQGVYILDVKRENKSEKETIGERSDTRARHNGQITSGQTNP